jgi:hypothetical protein
MSLTNLKNVEGVKKKKLIIRTITQGDSLIDKFFRGLLRQLVIKMLNDASIARENMEGMIIVDSLFGLRWCTAIK